VLRGYMLKIIRFFVSEQRVKISSISLEVNRSGINVEMQCFFAQYSGSIDENSEIEEIKWVGSEFKEICAPAAQLAIKFLVKHHKIRI